MGDLTATTVATNYKKFVRANGTNGRTLVLKLAGSNLTHANLQQVVDYLTTPHGTNGSGDSAFTVAGFGLADGGAFETGVTDTVYILAQGTGDTTVATLDCNIAGLTITIEAIFQDNYL